jgi:lipid-A-disaccharide synthase
MSGGGSGGERRPTIFVIAGEESGDILGANLMRVLADRLGSGVRFLGVGGARTAALGLTSMFPMEEVVLHGLAEVIVRAPRLFWRIRQTATAIAAADPDIVVLIDCPGFNLRVARRVRRLKPDIPIVDYVSPTVWAYFPGRARRMARYVDHLLAVLPFEPAVHKQLGGPPTTYVGHPLIERLVELRPARGERKPLGHGQRPVLLVLPGSRRSEISRLMDRFGETVALVAEHFGPVEVVLPAVAHLASEIRARAAAWRIQPTIVEGEAAARAAFRRAHAALAASGTVTLELALSGVPMVVAYRLDPLIRPFKWVLRAPSIVLPNLIAGANAVPEFLDGNARPEKLAAALIPLLTDSPERARQLAAFRDVEAAMMPATDSPSKQAADIVLKAMGRRPALAGPA